MSSPEIKITRPAEAFAEVYETMQSIETQLIETVHLSDVHRKLLVGAICMGSAVLLEGVPGTGKTTIAKRLATTIGGNFKRLQGTPDVMPGDITGSEIFNPMTREFEFRPGPVFANVLLADEINRNSPKAQSALLEAMQERQVTVGNHTYLLPNPFIVLGTENPVEHAEGTSRLPKAGLDRFAISLELPVLNADAQIAVARKQSKKAQQVVDISQLPTITDTIESMVVVGNETELRTAHVIDALRLLPDVDLDDSVIGGFRPYDETIRHAKAYAVSQKEQIVNGTHIDAVMPYVLRHRIQPNYDSGVNAQEIVERAIWAA